MSENIKEKKTKIIKGLEVALLIIFATIAGLWILGIIGLFVGLILSSVYVPYNQKNGV
jgi:hypothetical protein